jgi:hypothetical protein
VPRIEALLEPGGAVALVPVLEGAGDAAGWLRSCGKTQLAAWAALDVALRRAGGVPAYLLTDNEKTVTVEHVAGVPVRNCRETFL